MIVASLYPDRITVRHKNTVAAVTTWERKMYREQIKLESPELLKDDNSLKNLQLKKTNWALSTQTKRKISNSISLLNHLSTPRTIFLNSPKPIYNFRTSFITLTLPVNQVHPDKLIKSKCLNHFLTTMRQKFGLKNYVWKAELQNNSNIHFHIVWDIYIHHSAVRYYWNKSIDLLGYVSKYKNQFENMSLKEYAAYRGIEVSKALSGYIRGRDTYWESPPTEQVKAVRNAGILASYLRKYMLKPSSTNTDEDKQRVLDFGRVWGRSESLSAIVFTTLYDWNNLKEYLSSLGSIEENFHECIYEYCTVYYVDFKKASKRLLFWLEDKMKDLGVTSGYVPSG